jgi:REP element-mobilizing transposase RayT
VFNPDKHHRRSIRLQEYDYSQDGAYFVTICTSDRACIFGEVIDGTMYLNDAGRIVRAAWDETPDHHPWALLDAFVLMPNHVHGIIVLDGDSLRAGHRPAPTVKRSSLPDIIRAFKSFSAHKVNAARHTPGVPMWQRGYYEHIIRNEQTLNAMRQYIAHNPANWPADTENLHPIRS